MKATNMTKKMIDRTAWVSALTALPNEQLLSLTAALSKNWTIRPRSVPQSGLGMLKLNDSAFDESFYLGEFPMATAWLEVQTHEGVMVEGAAQVMDDRVEVAEALAICDAVLSAQLPGWELLNEMLDKGVAIREAIKQERKQILASTQVDFSLLEDAADVMDGNNMADNHVES